MNHTMSNERMEKLLSSTETSICDFKQQIYAMDEERGRISFLKDILCMANTVREESAYIVIGVQQQDGYNYFQNVDTSVDENSFLTFLKSNIGPRPPIFSYYHFRYKKYILGIIEVGVGTEGPYYSMKDYGDKIKKDTIYCRYSSSNHEADERDIVEITEWMNNSSQDKYSVLFSDLEKFDVDRYNYVLFWGNDSQKIDESKYALLGKINWSLIVDMQRGSETNEFYHHIHHSMDKKISVHTLTSDEYRVQTFSEGKTLLWFLAGAEKNKNDISVTAREWRKEYFRKVESVLSYINQNAQKPLIYVSLLMDDEFSIIVDCVVGAHEDNPLFGKYITIQWTSEFDRSEENGYIRAQGTLHGIFSVFHLFDKYEPRDMDEMYRLPTSTGVMKEINRRSWIDEELEPLYEKISFDNRSVGIDEENKFFCGGVIPWNRMNPCIAVKRGKYDELVEAITNRLSPKNNRANMIRFEYQAGAGATTIARMLAWHFHDKCPVVVLHKYSTGTVERLKSIYTDTEKSPMLLVIDQINIDEQIVEDLKQALQVEQVQVLILFVKRYLYSYNKENNSNSYYLPENLDRSEKEAFGHLYMDRLSKLDIDSYEKTQRRNALCLMSMDENTSQTPFLYALTTYESNFIKLDDYVASHLSKLDEYQEKVFRLLSVVQVYAGCEVPLFALPSESAGCVGRMKLENRFTGDQKTLLIFSSVGVRIIHHCVAQVVLQYICSLHMKNKSGWKNNLKESLLKTIQDFLPYHEHASIHDILQKIFFQQTDSKIKRVHFADAIEDLGTPEEKGAIFACLCDSFPYDPYVYSNRARYYHFLVEDEELALAEINRAIDLKEDYTFFHIKGNILTRRFLISIKNNAEEIRKNIVFFIDEVTAAKKQVFSAYDKSIELKYNNTYAYTDKIRFCVSVIKNIRHTVYQDKTTTDFLKYEKFYWYMEMMDDIQNILDNMQSLQEYAGIDFGSDLEMYRNQLMEFKGDTSAAIEGWNNLLTKKDVYRPVIRRLLVEGYACECGGRWNKLNKKKQEYVNKILEANIAEERDEPKNVLKWFYFIRLFEGNLRKAVQSFSMSSSYDDMVYYFYGMVVSYVYVVEYQDNEFMNMAQRYANKCENLARNFPNRSAVKEFYDPQKTDILSIVDYHSLRQNRGGFDDVLAAVHKIEGRILRIDKPESGVIQIEGTKFQVKFNPSRNKEAIYRKDRDENKRVEFVLGFRYEGPYAYAVTSL